MTVRPTPEGSLLGTCLLHQLATPTWYIYLVHLLGHLLATPTWYTYRAAHADHGVELPLTLILTLTLSLTLSLIRTS